MNYIQATEYIKNNLLIIEKTYQDLGRCYSGGTVIYIRKDGKPPTDTDLQAVNSLCYGQYHKANIKDNSSIFLKWRCDSGD